MEKFLKFIISALVDNPKAVKINTQTKEGEIIFAITVAPQDMGKIIGKKGRIIKAIRNLLRIRAIKEGKRVQLILENENYNPKEKGFARPPSTGEKDTGK